jgi:hypothetical protein
VRTAARGAVPADVRADIGGAAARLTPGAGTDFDRSLGHCETGPVMASIMCGRVLACRDYGMPTCARLFTPYDMDVEPLDQTKLEECLRLRSLPDAEIAAEADRLYRQRYRSPTGPNVRSETEPVASRPKASGELCIKCGFPKAIGQRCPHCALAARRRRRRVLRWIVQCTAGAGAVFITAIIVVGLYTWTSNSDAPAVKPKVVDVITHEKAVVMRRYGFTGTDEELARRADQIKELRRQARQREEMERRVFGE